MESNKMLKTFTIKKRYITAIVIVWGTLTLISTILGILIYDQLNTKVIARLDATANDRVRPKNPPMDLGVSYKEVLIRLLQVEKGLMSYKIKEGKAIPIHTLLTGSEFDDIASEIAFYKVVWSGDDVLAMAIASGEAEYNKYMKSSKNAQGIFQLMPRTARWMADKLDIFGSLDLNNVKLNAKLGLRYLTYCKYYLKHELGREPSTMEIAWAYNAGHECVRDAIKSGSPSLYLPYETILYGIKVKYYYTNYQANNYNCWYYSKDLYDFRIASYKQFKDNYDNIVQQEESNQ